jgi:hypothetical protein
MLQEYVGSVDGLISGDNTMTSIPFSRKLLRHTDSRRQRRFEEASEVKAKVNPLSKSSWTTYMTALTFLVLAS